MRYGPLADVVVAIHALYVGFVVFGIAVPLLLWPDFARQLTTMKVTNAPDVAARIDALNGFGRLFAGELWKMYGGALAHVINPSGAPPAPTGRTLGDRFDGDCDQPVAL